MAFELEYKTETMPSLFRLPRRFADFDEAWDTAKRLIDVYNMSADPPIELHFTKVD